MPADPQYDVVHEKAKPSSDYYGCHNRPRPQLGQAVVSTQHRVSWPYAFKTECMYDRSERDTRCKGCDHGDQAVVEDKPYDPIAAYAAFFSPLDRLG